jgi:hypothetical protein
MVYVGVVTIMVYWSVGVLVQYRPKALGTGTNARRTVHSDIRLYATLPAPHAAYIPPRGTYIPLPTIVQ